MNLSNSSSRSSSNNNNNRSSRSSIDQPLQIQISATIEFDCNSIAKLNSFEITQSVSVIKRPGERINFN